MKPMTKKQIMNRIKKIEKLHSKGYAICEDALAQADEIFNYIEDYQHCQTSECGAIEVIIGRFENGDVAGDYSMSQAFEMLKLETSND